MMLCLSLSHCRPGVEDLVRYMKTLGAAEVITEEFAASHRMRDLLTVSNLHALIDVLPLWGSKNNQQICESQVTKIWCKVLWLNCTANFG